MASHVPISFLATRRERSGDAANQPIDGSASSTTTISSSSSITLPSSYLGALLRHEYVERASRFVYLRAIWIHLAFAVVILSFCHILSPDVLAVITPVTQPLRGLLQFLCCLQVFLILLAHLSLFKELSTIDTVRPWSVWNMYTSVILVYSTVYFTLFTVDRSAFALLGYAPDAAKSTDSSGSLITDGGGPAELSDVTTYNEPVAVYIFFIYFSSAIITSTGFGDIVPTRAPSQMLTNLQMLIGMIYHAGIFGFALDHFMRVQKKRKMNAEKERRERLIQLELEGKWRRWDDSIVREETGGEQNNAQQQEEEKKQPIPPANSVTIEMNLIRNTSGEGVDNCEEVIGVDGEEERKQPELDENGLPLEPQPGDAEVNSTISSSATPTSSHSSLSSSNNSSNRSTPSPVLPSQRIFLSNPSSPVGGLHHPIQHLPPLTLSHMKKPKQQQQQRIFDADNDERDLENDLSLHDDDIDDAHSMPGVMDPLDVCIDDTLPRMVESMSNSHDRTGYHLPPPTLSNQAMAAQQLEKQQQQQQKSTRKISRIIPDTFRRIKSTASNASSTSNASTTIGMGTHPSFTQGGGAVGSVGGERRIRPYSSHSSDASSNESRRTSGHHHHLSHTSSSHHHHSSSHHTSSSSSSSFLHRHFPLWRYLKSQSWFESFRLLIIRYLVLVELILQVVSALMLYTLDEPFTGIYNYESDTVRSVSAGKIIVLLITSILLFLQLLINMSINVRLLQKITNEKASRKKSRGISSSSSTAALTLSTPNEATNGITVSFLSQSYLSTVLVFSSIYFFLFTYTSSHEFSREKTFSITVLDVWFTFIYFSCVVMTGTGFGDLFAKGWVSRCVASVQMIISIVYACIIIGLGMFVLCEQMEKKARDELLAKERQVTQLLKIVQHRHDGSDQEHSSPVVEPPLLELLHDTELLKVLAESSPTTIAPTSTTTVTPRPNHSKHHSKARHSPLSAMNATNSK